MEQIHDLKKDVEKIQVEKTILEKRKVNQQKLGSNYDYKENWAENAQR